MEDPHTTSDKKEWPTDPLGEEEVVEELSDREKELWGRLSAVGDRLHQDFDPAFVKTALLFGTYYITKAHGIRWLDEDGNLFIHEIKDGHIVRRKVREEDAIDPSMKEDLTELWQLFRAVWELARGCTY